VGAIIQDITEKKRSADELSRHRDKLQDIVDKKTRELADSLQRLHSSERLAALGTLAAGLGHDLANLVLPIRARLESLAVAPATPEMRGDIVAIGQALDHLSNLSAGMRLMALDPTRSRAASEATDLSVWWTEAQGVLRGVLPRSVRLEAKIAGGLGVALPRHQLLQAVFNLVQNAGEVLDHDADGWVRVEVEADPEDAGEFVLISVRDNGPGMTDEVKSRCFDPYFSTKGRSISTGMGLSLVRGLVESVKGSVSVESRQGGGTTFTLRLPRFSPLKGLLHRRSGAARSAAISITEPRQAALATMIAERLDLRVETLRDRATPQAEVWITDAASRGEVEYFLAEAEEHRVVYLGSRHFDPATLNDSERYRGRVVVLPFRPAPIILRETLLRVVEGGA
jgi:anti-sigma regulatory factor (Ser/Thr protein kinase)